jgi:hypothetical protein
MTMTKRFQAFFATSLALATWAQGVAGQDGAAARAAVDRMFEGMRTADSAMVRSTLATDVRFAILDAREGAPTIRVQNVDGWVRGIAGSGGAWNEQIYDVQVLVDGAMASIWAPYTFYLDGAISHCGINSIELLRDADGWKVTQISDTRSSEGCPDPLGSS